MNCIRRLPCILALVCSGLFVDAASLRAESPSDDLLRLVPDDSTFCIVVQKPRELVDAVWKGPLVESIRKSPLGDAIRQAPELEQLRQLEKFLSVQLEIDFAGVFENCFGDALVLAYQAGPPGKPELERGVIMSWVRDPKLLQSTLDKLDAAQKQSGELKEIRKLAYQGQSYQQRIKAKGPDEFLFFDGNVLAFSAQEPAIQQIIARNVGQSKNRISQVTRQLQNAGCSDAAAALWINPRSFDADLALKAKDAKDNEAAFLTTFKDCWQALDSVVVGLHVRQHLEIALALDLKPEKLPALLRPLLQGPSAPSELWASFPANPMFAVSGRTNLPMLIEAIGLFLSPEAKKSLQASLEQTFGPAFGKKFLPKIPELLGPDWGICFSRPSDAKQLLPDAVAAVRVSSDAKDADALQNLMTGLDSLVTLFRLDYNSKHADQLTKKTLRTNGTEVQYLEGERGWPPGLRPAFGLKDGCLVLASRPELVTGFSRTSAAKPKSNQEIPLVRVSFREWKNYLGERQSALAEFAKSDGKPAAEVGKQFEQLDMLLQFLDHFEVVQKPAQTGLLRLAARLHFAAPLRR